MRIVFAQRDASSFRNVGFMFMFTSGMVSFTDRYPLRRDMDRISISNIFSYPMLPVTISPVRSARYP
jgi:hypothetical protein